MVLEETLTVGYASSLFYGGAYVNKMHSFTAALEADPPPHQFMSSQVTK